MSRERLEQFVAEGRPQLEHMQARFFAHRDNTSDTEALSEARRSAHRIKGEASMIGQTGFSHVAALIEELLSELENQTPEDPQPFFGLIDHGINSLFGFFEQFANEGQDERDSLIDFLKSYRRFRQLPEDGDDDEVLRLIYDTSDGADASETQDDASLAIDPQHLDSFQQEATDHLQIVLNILAQGDDLDETEIQEIRRAFHCVKGGASAVGLQEVAETSHLVEDLVDHVADERLEFNEATRDLLIKSVDTLSEFVEEGSAAVSLSDLRAAIRLTVSSGEEAVTIEPESTRDEEIGKVVEAAAEAAAAAVTQEAIDMLRSDIDHTVPDELYAVYREEAEDHIKMIYSGLNALQTEPANRDELQNVRRSAHTLKGAAGAVGFRVVTKLSHRMEDLLDRLYDNNEVLTPQNLTLLLNTTDALHDLSFDEFDKEEILGKVVQLYGEYAQELSDTEEPQQPSVEFALDVNAQIAKPEEPAEATPAKKAPAAADSSQMLRVPLARIDDLVRTVSELIINRTTFEQRMADFVRGVDEMGAILDRLRTVSAELETRYSVDALGGRNVLGHAGLSTHEPQKALPMQTSESRMSEFDALEFDQYNEFHLLARSVGEVTNDVNTVTNEMRTLIGDFDSLLARQDRLSRDTQDRLMRVRMVPLAVLATRLHRAVRVVASNQNKKVELVIDGEGTELDKTVLEEIADPLLHLLRNAVDHGVEPSDLRVIKGKVDRATIRIRAFYQGTQVVIRISDDGAGLDPNRIAEVAVERGYLSKSDLENMTPQELFPYIFIPGLSTASQLSEVSGRGVGMDIVRDKVQKLKGTITVDSEPDKGTTFTIRLPLTLAVTRALMVVAGGQRFAIPMQSVDQIARVDRETIETLGSEPVIRFNGTACPIIRLSEYLGLHNVDDEGRTIPILIVRSGDQQTAVRVDGIVAGRDIVVKTLGSHLRKVKGLIGSTLLGDGTVVPILDPTSFGGGDANNLPTLGSERIGRGVNDALTVMIVDDSVSVRRVTENLIVSQGWKTIVAKDGLDAIELLQSTERTPDIFLLDVEMPRMDGYELLATLRGMDKTANTPVVMVTSRAGAKHRDKAFALGATDYVVKPYQDEEMIALVKRLTASKESSLA